MVRNSVDRVWFCLRPVLSFVTSWRRSGQNCSRISCRLGWNQWMGKRMRLLCFGNCQLTIVSWVCFSCPVEQCGMAFAMSHHCKAHQQSRHGKNFSASEYHQPLYKWCTVASGTFKYVVPRLTCHHKGAARLMTFQPRSNIFECSTSNHASSVLSYDQLVIRQNITSKYKIPMNNIFTFMFYPRAEIEIPYV